MAKQDTMTKDIRKNIAEVFGRVPKYATGVGKLFLASGKEIFNIEMPYIGAMYETNQDLLKEVIRTLRNPADAINKQVNRALQSETAVELQKFGKYLIDDLKSGNLYDENRMRSVGGSVEDMLSEFGGFDMDGFDESGEWDDSSFDDSGSETDIKIAEVQEENANKRTGAVIDAIATSTEATVVNANANAQANLRTSMKQHAQQMNGMQNLITTQSATFELINKSINAQLDVTREAHQQVMGKFDEITALLAEIRDGVNPPKQVEKEREQEEIFGAHGALNIANYLKQVIKNIDDKFQISNTISMGTAGASPAQLIQMVSDNPLTLITDQILNKVIKKEWREQMAKTNKNLSSLGPALLQKLFTKGRDYQYADEENNSGIGGLLASLFGVTQRSRSAIDIAYKDPLAATQFNMKTSRAIEEVIPMWLSKIYSAISGDPLMIYNYSTGKLEKVADVISTNYKNARDLAGKMGDTEYEIDRRVEYFKFKDSVDKEDFRNFTYRFLQKYAESGEFIDPHMSRDKFKETFSSLSSGFKNTDNQSNVDQYYALFTAILKSLPDNVRLGMAKDMAEARETRNSNNSKINNALKESGLGAAFSGFIDPKLESEIQRLTMNGRRTLTGEDLQDNLDQYKAKLKIKTGTAGTNSLLTDILSTLRKGLITYSYSVGAIDDSSPNNEILKLVQKGADDQKKYDDVVKKYHDDIEARKQKRKEDEHKKFVAEGKISHYADKIQVTENIDPSIAEVIQHLANVDNMPKSKVDNKVSEAHARWFEGRKDSVKKLISEVGDTTGATSLIKTLQKVAEEPFKLFDEGLKLADAFMLKLVFGEDSIASDDPNKEPNLMDTISKSLRIHFLDAKNWFKSEIANPMHDILLDKDEGVLPRISKAVGELFGFKDGKNPIKDTVNKLEERFLGKKVEEKDENGKVISSRREGGKFSNQMNRLHDKTNELKSGTKAGVNDFVTRLLYGDYGTTKGVGTYMDLDDNGNVVAGRAYGGAIGWFKKIGTDFREMMLGPDGEETDSKNKWKTVTGELHKAYPDMIVGGGVGLLASLFLPGGPILGTIIGSTAGLVHGSDKLSEFLFGKFSETEDEIVRDKDGNPVIDRKTGKPKMRKTQTKSGLLDRDLVDGFKQFFPGIAIGAGAGGLIGSIGLLPFGLGGAAGTVIGGVTGMLASSDQVKTLIFGEFGDDDSGLISKNFRKKVVETVKKYAPPVLGLGAAGGALGNLLGAGLGLIPGLSLLPTGPIFGIMGALMGVANADQINKFLFGDEVEETAEVDDGKGGKKKVTRKKREGGIFGGIHDFARDKIITPLGNKFNEVGYKVQGWFQESIITPLRNSMEPLKNRMREAGEKIFGSMKNIGEKITESIFKVFNISLNGDDGEGGLKAWFHDKVLKRLDNMANKIFDTIGLILGKIIAAPFKAFEMLVTGKIGDRTEDDLADAASDKRKNKRNAHREKQREAMLGRASKNLNKSGGFLHNLWTRITGKDKEEPMSTAADISSSSTTESGSITTQAPGSPAYSAAANGITNPDQLRDVAQQVVNESRTNNRNDWDNQDKYGNTNGIGTRPDSTQVPSLSESMTSAAKPSTDDASKTKAAGEARGEEETRKKTTRSIGAKTNNEYLREIAKSTTGIYSEIKGQLGGTGWNVAYIKAMLDKQFQPLSDDELPEEMEGSKKVKKRRGLLGKAKDAVFGFAGAAKDKIVGIASKVVDVVSAPFKLIAKVVIGAKDAIKSFVGGLWDGIKQIGGLVLGAAKTIGDILREIGIGFAEGVGEVLRGAGELIHKAAGGIGEAIGNIASTLTGVLHDTTLALSSAALGLFQTAAAIAPDIALGLWDGAKWLGGTAIKGVKGAAKFVWKGMKKAGRGVKKGVSWIFGKITGRGKHKDEDGSSNGYDGSSISIDGGYLDSVDSITNNVPVAVGGNANIPFPVVSMSRGKPVELFGIRHAIPVYVVGNGMPPRGRTPRLKAITDSTSGNGNQRNTGNQTASAENGVDDYVDAYRNIDAAAERSDNPNVYDEAMSKAKSKEEIEAIRDAHQLNLGARLRGLFSGNSSEKKEKKEGFFSKLIDMISGGKGAISTILKILPAGLINFAIPAFATVANLKSGHTSWGLRNATTTANNGIQLASKVLSHIDDFATLVKSPAAADAAIGLGSISGKISGHLANGIRNAASGLGDIGRVAVGNVDDIAEIGPVKKAIGKAIGALINNATVKKMFGALSGKLSAVGKKLTSFISDKVLKKAMDTGGKGMLKNAGKQIAAFLSGGMLQAAFSAVDFISGFGNAKKYFNVFGSDVTLAMRLTSAVVNTLGGLLNLIPIIGPMLSIAVGLFQDQIVQMVYGVIADDAAQKDLAYDQLKLKAATDTYNSSNGTNLSVDEYAKKFNEDGTEKKGILSKIGNFFSGIGNAIGKGVGGVASIASTAATKIAGGAPKNIDKNIVSSSNKSGKGVGAAIGLDNPVGGVGSKAVDIVGKFVKNPIGSTVTFFNEMVPYALGYTARSVYDFAIGIGTAVKGFFTKAVDTVKTVFGDIRDWIVNAATNVVTFVTDLPGKIAKWATDTWNTITGAVSQIGTNIVNFITSIPGRIGDAFTAIGKTVATTVINIERGIVDFIKSIPNRIGDFITAGTKGIGDWVGDWFGWVNSGFNKDDVSWGTGNASVARVDEVTDKMQEIGRGIGDRLVSMMTDTYKQKSSAPGLFNLIGEGLGNSLLDDLRKTEGNKANLNTVMTNAVGTSMQTTVKNSNSEPWYKKAAGAVKNFFGWGKGTEDTDKTEWGTGVKPMSQKDTRWNQSDSKMATTGCGPTAAAIVASKYDKNANPAEANAASRNLGMRASDGGTNPAFFGQYASKHGYGMRQGPVDSGSIQSNLRSNQPVVVMGKGGAFGNNMHYMVADRSNNNGTVGLIDPLSGGRRSTTMDDLMANTKNAIYSFGKGPVTPEDKKASAESSSGISTSEAQQKLVQKMEWLSQHPIRYSLEGSQDPDKGSASCASTVGWAYRKVFGQELNGMSASSKEQAKDSRFTTIWGNPANEGTQPGKLLDFSIMQPGDIVYMKNPTSNHTEMYAGNGMNWSHGGPEDGPTLRPLDEKRQKRVWAINRYTPFLNGQPVQVHEGQLISKGSSGAAASGTAAGVAAGSGSLSELFTPDGASGGYTASGLLNAFLGIGSVIGSGISNALTMLLGGTVSDTENGSTSSVAGIAKNSSMKKSTTGTVPYTESNLTRDESKKTVWKFLHDQGFNDIGASGVMGCWQEESYNTADRVEGDYLPQYPGAKTVLANNQSLNDYTTKILFPAYANSKPPYKVNKEAYKGNDGNYYPGFGLAQWTGPRGYDMIKYAESQGKDWRDIRTQLEFAATEMNTRGLADIVNSATDPAEAAHKVLDHYEMYVGYGDNNPKELNKRTAHANAIYNLFSAEGSEPSEDVDAEDDDLGDKKNRPSDVKTEWGTGPSATLSALNDKIQNINRMFTSMREETAEDTTIAQVTGKLTEAINNVSNPTSSDSEQMMKIMAQSLATMVELLTAIKENTTPKKEAQPESTPQSKKLPVAKAKAFDDESGVGTNDRDIGASIIDVLTSK